MSCPPGCCQDGSPQKTSLCQDRMPTGRASLPTFLFVNHTLTMTRKCCPSKNEGNPICTYHTRPADSFLCVRGRVLWQRHTHSPGALGYTLCAPPSHWKRCENWMIRSCMWAELTLDHTQLDQMPYCDLLCRFPAGFLARATGSPRPLAPSGQQKSRTPKESKSV